MLNDYLAKLPKSVIVDIEITDDKVVIPTKINEDEFYNLFKDEIEAETFTTEKAIYLASVNIPKRTKSIPSLLIKGR